MNKSNRYIKNVVRAFVGASIVFIGAEMSFAQSTQNKKKAVPVKKALPKKTVGDMLKDISKTKQTLNINKTETALPKFESNYETKAVNTSAVKPPNTRDMFRATGETGEEKLEIATDQSIAELYKLTVKYKTSPNRGELWMRLGENYVEKAFLVNLRLQKQYDLKLREYDDKKSKVKPKLDLSLSHEYNRKAIQLYEWFIRDFPNDKKVDQALFFLGYNYFELGNTKKGSEYYEKLVREHKKSPYIAESYFSLGEYYFDNQQWAKAQKHYQDVMVYKNTRLYGLALYKISWCQYRLSHTDEALKTMEKVISASRQDVEDASGKKVNKLRLASEALNDMIVFYGQIGEAANAKTYFSRFTSGANLTKALEKLAYYYRDYGRRDAAQYVFKELINDNPTSARAFDYQHQIVNTYGAAGDMKTYRSELYAWIQNFNETSEWWKANQKDQTLIAEAKESRERTLREHALNLHREGQKSHADNTMKLAFSAYKMFISYFPNSKYGAEMHFFYAELLFDAKMYAEAGAQYLWVADNAPQSEYHEKAVLNTLLALEKSLPGDAEIRARVGSSTEPVPLGQVEKNFESGCKRYLKSFPHGEKANDVKFRLARMYYTYNQFDAALYYFREVIKENPASKNAEYSANLILDIYNLRKDYEGMIKAGNELMQMPGLDKANIGKDLRGVVDRLNFKKAQELESQKDYLGSAKKFEEFAKNNPGSEHRTTAQYNAAINYERAGQAVSAIAMFALVSSSKDEKQKDLVAKSKKSIVALYEKTGQYNKAASSMEELIHTEKNHVELANLYYNVAVIRAAQGYHPQAISYYEKYFEASKKSDRSEALFYIGMIYWKQKKYGPAVKYFEKYMDSGARNPNYIMQSQYKIAKHFEMLGNRDKTKAAYKKLIANQKYLAAKTPGVGARYAAEGKFYLAQETQQNMVALKIPKNPAKQGAVVKEKLAFLDRYNKELIEVIRYDDGEQIINALYSLGGAYEHMYHALLNAPKPDGFTVEEMAAYNAQLNQIADPILAKAKENYQAAIDRGFELQVYSDHILSAQKALRGIEKTKSFDGQEKNLPVSLMDTMGL